MNNLAFAYEHGEGVRKDRDAAMKWYRAAIEKGNLAARWNLAIILDGGDVDQLDAATAARYLLEAAKGGHELSREALLGTDFNQTWSRAVRRAVQQELADGGYYSGGIDGDFGAGSRRAVEAMLKQ